MVKIYENKKVVKEDTNRGEHIVDVSNASPLPEELYDRTFDVFTNGIMVTPENDASCPWDADIYIDGDNFVLKGGILPGGPGYGSCVVKVPKSKANDVYEISVWVEESDEAEEVISELAEYGWIVK